MVFVYVPQLDQGILVVQILNGRKRRAQDSSGALVSCGLNRARGLNKPAKISPVFHDASIEYDEVWMNSLAQIIQSNLKLFSPLAQG